LSDNKLSLPTEKDSFLNIFGSKARVKILCLLALRNELSVSQIVEQTKLNHGNAIQHLRFLVECNMVQENKFGKIRIFRYKTENIRAKAFQNFLSIWDNKYQNTLKS